MVEKNADATVAGQIELAICRLNSLSILPSVVGRFLSQLLQFQLSPSQLAEIIESDPTLTARIILLLHQEGISFPDGEFPIRRALDKLALRDIRNAFLSTKVYRPCDPEPGGNVFRKELVRHCIAVGCCARAIAEITPSPVDPQMALLAGLLHDIGKLALDEAMTKSFARILEQAKSKKSSSHILEQKHLGADHTIFGKRLGEKWHLPGEVITAIWLHHTDTVTISQTMPQAQIAQVVQLADLVARQAGIGNSGSFDTPDSVDSIAQSLQIDTEQLEQIRHNLTSQVAEKSELLGLDLPRPEQAYCDSLAATAAQLAKDNTKLSQKNLRLQVAANHLDFANDFLSSAISGTTPIDIAQNFALRWQKFYQTGPVCLYLAAGRERMVKAVVVEGPSLTKTLILNVPADTEAIPNQIAETFGILDADERSDWLFDQLDVDFDLGRTMLVPLLSGGRAIGVIVCELRYPATEQQLRERFNSAASFAAAVLHMAVERRDQQYFAEQFAQLITPQPSITPPIPQPAPKDAKAQPAANTSTAALAEMAAGAAHELNNPLSVISGRAQLLSKAEDDPQKKRMLKQIQDNAGDLANIIDDLMSFAEPQPPRPTTTNIKQILDEAAQLAAQKQGVESLHLKIEIDDSCRGIFADSAQIVSAVANILSNSLESYDQGSGPIEATALPDASGEFVSLKITDFGCGMDEETLRKATQPFFCSKPAGRKRGMGLAHAERLIQLNKGLLNIDSTPKEGTTVKILLPVG